MSNPLMTWALDCGEDNLAKLRNLAQNLCDHVPSDLHDGRPYLALRRHLRERVPAPPKICPHCGEMSLADIDQSVVGTIPCGQETFELVEYQCRLDNCGGSCWL